MMDLLSENIHPHWVIRVIIVAAGQILQDHGHGGLTSLLLVVGLIVHHYLLLVCGQGRLGVPSMIPLA
jgi:hypothetical protein